jgi:hypothetical protein
LSSENNILQVGSAPENYWSIVNFNVIGENPPSSYPGISHEGWSATASHTETGSEPNNAIDGNLNTRWASGMSQTAGGSQWFQLDLGAIQKISRIDNNVGTNYMQPYQSMDHLRGYNVYVHDGNEWIMVANGEGTFPVTTIRFPEVDTQYINIQPTVNTTEWFGNAVMTIDPKRRVVKSLWSSTCRYG